MKKLFAAVMTAVLFQLTVFAQAKIQDSVKLTAVGAPWDVVIEGEALDIKQVGTKPGGAYYLLYPNKDGVNISLYIEPAERCKTSDGCRDFVLNAGNPAWGKFEGLNKAKFGQFSYFEFFRPEVRGQPLKMQDMYAQYVDQGYWVDLHLSKVLYKKEDRPLFEKLMSSIKFVPKDRAASAGKDLDSIRKAADTWLGLWGERKCGETYRALTSISREAVKEGQWLEYCTAAHQGLGKLSSRELIAVTSIGSLPGRPDRAGAAFRYQSQFEHRSGVELISFTQEKDGTWTVSNYLVQ